MKTMATQLTLLLRMGQQRSNMRLLFKFVLILMFFFVLYSVLLSITGVYHGGIQIGLKLSDERGSLKEVLDCVRGHKARISSILTSYDKVEKGYRQVFIRIMDMDKSALNELQNELTEKYNLTFWVRDNLN